VLNSAKLGAFIKVIKCGTTKFGVKSSFDEEIYTTKLERGPNMDELEKKALRIAREIEGEQTQDLHLAEVRLF
jgi:PAB1-binding protein PBP1